MYIFIILNTKQSQFHTEAKCVSSVCVGKVGRIIETVREALHTGWAHHDRCKQRLKSLILVRGEALF